MPASVRSSDVHISYNTADTSSRNKDPEALGPDLVELVEELLVVVDVAELAGVVRLILFEVRIRRRGHHKMDRLVLQLGHLPAVSEDDVVGCWPVVEAFPWVRCWPGWHLGPSPLSRRSLCRGNDTARIWPLSSGSSQSIPVPRVRHPEPPPYQPAVLDREPGRRGQPPKREALKSGQDLPDENLGVGPLVLSVPGVDLTHVPGVRPPHLPLGLRALARVDPLSPQPRQPSRPRCRERGSPSPPILRQAFVAVGPARRVQDKAAASARGRQGACGG